MELSKEALDAGEAVWRRIIGEAFPRPLGDDRPLPAVRALIVAVAAALEHDGYIEPLRKKW